jgi:hypothetical protein
MQSCYWVIEAARNEMLVRWCVHKQPAAAAVLAVQGCYCLKEQPARRCWCLLLHAASIAQLLLLLPALHFAELLLGEQNSLQGDAGARVSITNLLLLL